MTQNDGSEADDRIAELFAGLTGLLEDAAVLAAEGQRAGIPARRCQGDAA